MVPCGGVSSITNTASSSLCKLDEGRAVSLARDDDSVGTMVDMGAHPRLDMEAIIFFA